MTWLLLGPDGEEHSGSYWGLRDVAEELFVMTRRWNCDGIELAPKIARGWALVPEAMIRGQAA
jgi:hypothetical protein